MTSPLSPRCTVPPEGWRCTRKPGHDGPCAALPDDGCTCDVRGPAWDDTTFDPACRFHGEGGSMVARIARRYLRRFG